MMNVAEKFAGKFDTVSNLAIHLTAIYLLAGSDVPEVVRDEALEIASSGLPVTKETAKRLIAKHKAQPDDDDADPFGGLSPDDVGRASGTLGFFGLDDLRRPKAESPYPPDDVLSLLAFLMRGIHNLYVRERGRRKKHDEFRCKGLRDAYFAGLVRHDLADVVIEGFSDDDANFDLLRERVGRACEGRKSRRPKADT